MKIVATIEARMTSKRLPGKVMLPILEDIPVIEYLLGNIDKSKHLSEIVIATTVNAADDVLVDAADKHKAMHFRGYEDNVLKRVSDAHSISGSDVAVLLTADNPFVTSMLIDETIDFYLKSGSDFVSNSGPNRLYPDGVDVIVTNPKWLKWSLERADDQSHLEHVCSMIYGNDSISKSFLDPIRDCDCAPDISVTVDTIVDYERAMLLARNLPENYAIQDLIVAWKKLAKTYAWK